MFQYRLGYITILSVLVVVLPGVVQATADGPDYYQASSEQAVSVHQNGSSQAQIVFELPNDAKWIKKLSCRGVPSFHDWSTIDNNQKQMLRRTAWCKILYQGKEGWIKARYLSEFSPSVQPTFNCASTRNSIELRICHSKKLSALDVKMKQVFHAVLSKLAEYPEKISSFKAYQRGWIKGRNECWKAADKLTCIRDSYQRRLSLLEAQWQLVPVHTTLRVNCQNMPLTIKRYQNSTLPSLVIVEHNRPLVADNRQHNEYLGEFGYRLVIHQHTIRIFDPAKQPVTCQILPR